IEIVMGSEQAFGVCISDEEAEELRTPGDLIDLIRRKIGAVDARPSHCLTARAFYRIRQRILEETELPRATILPNTKIAQLFLRGAGRKQWSAVGKRIGAESWPRMLFGFGCVRG